ncbi:hypothetical protein O6H91_17G030400 [Diphasiastrum complanatum]|uniref:Uncharacterized protein n=1 Tax=Diphasiastrum complanatum TaxID=34168 RepID=A0ACC2B5A4_DIPCM|nr:hypothetical protein O6H91_17G030400 [Diphasiastrum complanatum]
MFRKYGLCSFYNNNHLHYLLTLESALKSKQLWLPSSMQSSDPSVSIPICGGSFSFCDACLLSFFLRSMCRSFTLLDLDKPLLPKQLSHLHLLHRITGSSLRMAV